MFKAKVDSRPFSFLFFFFFINFFNNLTEFNQHPWPPLSRGERQKGIKRKGDGFYPVEILVANVHRSELVNPPLRFSAANKLGCVTRPRFPLTTRFSETFSPTPPSVAQRDARENRGGEGRIRDATTLIIRADTFRITLNRNSLRPAFRYITRLFNLRCKYSDSISLI